MVDIFRTQSPFRLDTLSVLKRLEMNRLALFWLLPGILLLNSANRSERCPVWLMVRSAYRSIQLHADATDLDIHWIWPSAIPLDDPSVHCGTHRKSWDWNRWFSCNHGVQHPKQFAPLRWSPTNGNLHFGKKTFLLITLGEKLLWTLLFTCVLSNSFVHLSRPQLSTSMSPV